MRISDWSSDVCSSDLEDPIQSVREAPHDPPIRNADRECLNALTDQVEVRGKALSSTHLVISAAGLLHSARHSNPHEGVEDRKSVGEGKSVSIRVDLGGRLIIKKKKKKQQKKKN